MRSFCFVPLTYVFLGGCDHNFRMLFHFRDCQGLGARVNGYIFYISIFCLAGRLQDWLRTVSEGTETAITSIRSYEENQE